MLSPTPTVGWSEDVYQVLRAKGIHYVATVPDGGLTAVLQKCDADSDIRVVPLTTEEEGVAFVCGVWLGGQRAALFMQSSGVGNCVNMLALPEICRIPCLMLVTMRGEWGEYNPWQIPMGRAVPRVFDAMGVATYRPTRDDDVGPTFESAANLVYNTGTSAAVLVGQRIIGSKSFERRPQHVQ